MSATACSCLVRHQLHALHEPQGNRVGTRPAVVDREPQAARRAALEEFLDHRLPNRAEAGDRGCNLDPTFKVRQHALDQNFQIAGGVGPGDDLMAMAACAPLRGAVYLKLLHISSPTNSGTWRALGKVPRTRSRDPRSSGPPIADDSRPTD